MYLTSYYGLWTYFDAMVNRWNTFDQGFWVPTAIYAQPSFDSGYVYVSQAQQTIYLNPILGVQYVENIKFVSISFADSPSPTEFYPLTLRHSPNYNVNPISMGFDTNEY